MFIRSLGVVALFVGSAGAHILPGSVVTAPSLSGSSAIAASRSSANSISGNGARAAAGDLGCKLGHEDRGSDLCAQWKAADAAADSARSAYWTMFAGAIGVFVGAGTLFAAWRAAHWAKAAAAHAKAGADAGKVANDIASDFTDRQLRAYLFPAFGELILVAADTIASCPMRVAFKNTGATPATLASYCVRTGVKSQLRRRAAGVENAEINRVQTKIEKIIGPHSETYISVSGNVELRMFSASHVAAAGGHSRAVEFTAMIDYEYIDYLARRWRVEAEFTTDEFTWNAAGRKKVTMRQKSAREYQVHNLHLPLD